MTLDLRTIHPIGGENPIRIRDILRTCKGAFRQDWLTNRFQYTEQMAGEITTALVASGYVQRDINREKRDKSTKSWYSLTDKGRTFSRGSAAARIKRETAEKALQEFMERVGEVNADPRYLYSVDKVVIFGSFLECSERLGDVDIAVGLRPWILMKRGTNWVRIYTQHAQDSGRKFSSFCDTIFWPQDEVLLALRARKRCISIQSWSSFVEMDKAPNFQYRVLLGDSEEIKRELANSPW